jgi:hypothetical protein
MTSKKINILRLSLCWLVYVLICISSSRLPAQTPVSGTITNTTWSRENSPYQVTGDITVQSLTIEAGVEVQFQNNYQFNISGRLTAIGSKQDSIRFINAPANVSGWRGLLFSTGSSVSAMAYCIIEDANLYGVRFAGSISRFEKCRVSNSAASGIEISSTTVEIKRCVITANSAHGISVSAAGKANILNCILSSNTNNGITIDGGCVQLTNSLVKNNGQGGIFLLQAADTLFMTNSNIVHNNSVPGIFSVGNQLNLKNSVVYFNGSGISTANAAVTYSDVQGGYTGTGNIPNDPLFANNNTYELLSNSLCIDGGNPGAVYDDICFPPSKGTTTNDMGIYGGPAACSWYDPLFVTPLALDFGQVTLGDTARLPISIKNYSDSMLTITRLQITGTDAVQYDHTQSTPINVSPFDSIQVQVQFSPDEARAFSAALDIITLQDSLQVSLSGTGVIPDIFVTPASANFNSVHVGDSLLNFVRIYNVGQGTLKIQDLTSSDRAFSPRFFNFPASILPAQMDTLYILFKPDTASSYSEHIIIHSNDPDEAQFSIDVNGTGLAPILTVIDSLNFAAVLLNQDSTSSVILKNTGNDTLQINSKNISGADSLSFQITSSQGAVILPPAAEDTVQILFQPLDTRLYSALLRVNSNDPFINPHYVVLQGRGVIPELALSSETLDFGQVQVNSDSLLDLVITNIGSAILQVRDIVILPDSSAFTIVNAGQNFNLPPGGAADSILISFLPVTAGSASAVLQMLTNDPAHDTLQIPLSGRGVNFEIAVTPDDSLDFSQIPIGQDSALTLLLENLGSGDLQVRTHIAGADSLHFRLGSSDSSFVIPEISPRYSLRVIFTPVTRGTKNAVLEIFSNDTDHPSILINLRGYALAAEIFTAPESISFDNTYIWENSTRSISIFNLGELALIIDSLRISGPDSNEFLIPDITLPLSIPAGPDSQPLPVQFNPLSGGTKNDLLLIYSNDPLSPASIDLNALALLDLTPAAMAIDTSSLNFTAGSNCSLQVVAQDDECIIQTVSVFVRSGGQQVYRQLNFTQNNDTVWSAVIPGQQITERGLEYYLEVHHGGAITFYPQNGAAEPEIGTVRVPYLSFPLATLSGKYQMISVPVRTGEQKLSDLFQDDLGIYDNINYRFFDWNSDSAAYKEMTDLDIPLPPGQALWLITREATALDLENAESNLSPADFALPLKAGWNMIANPFAFTVSWDQIDHDYIQGKTLWYYDGDGWIIASALVPYRGYAVQIISDTALHIPAQETESPVVPKPVPAAEWHLQLTADNGTHDDHYNYAGVRLAASDGWDICDISEPPGIGTFVSLYFQKDTTVSSPARLAGDFREPAHEQYSYNLMLNNSIPGKTRIQIIPHNLPDNFDWLVLSTHSKIRYPQESWTTDKSKDFFQLVVGTKSALQSVLDEYKEIPGSFQLTQNFPNPFNPTTTIVYQLPQSASISITIFDILGKKIKTILPETRQEAGYYQLHWDGRNDHNETVASAVYILFLHSDKYQQAIKMILQR